MTATELFHWLAFRQVFGPLTVQERIDVNGAITSWASVRAAGASKSLTPDKFMPPWDLVDEDVEDEDEPDPGAMVEFMRGLITKQKESGGY